MAKLLTICPYELLPLRGGGALRCFHLLRQLARSHEVHAIVFQRENELRQETEGYKVPDSLRIYSPLDEPPPSTQFHRLAPKLANALQYRWLRRSWSGPAAGEVLNSHHLIRRVLTENRIDAVVFEHLSTMKAAPLVRRLSPGSVRILDAHNVDHKLYAQELASRHGQAIPDRERRILAQTKWTEENLGRFVHGFWACSDRDRDALQALSGLGGFTIQNGIDTVARPFDPNPAKARIKTLLFCGSLSYGPNQKGLEWFRKEVWPQLRKADPSVRLRIIGSGAQPDQYAELGADSTVEFLGEVDTVLPHYRQSSVCIVPLLEGSGTRLKILEAMSLGNPVVSTRIGAEGIEASDGEHILLADDPNAFTSAILRLLHEPITFNNMRRAARRLVEARYDWALIGDRMNAALKLCCKTPAP